MSAIYDATDPDLRPFRDRGGKLILWHGWADSAAPPLGTVAYYQAVQDAMGGLGATQRFARLYMLPGVGHCEGMQGPFAFDLFNPLVDWVEQGAAPEGVIATQKQDDRIVRTRPVFPYPAVAHYTGSGSSDAAVNFAAAPPPTPPNDHSTWIGEYRSGYQEWCSWQGTNLVCTRGRPDQPAAPKMGA